MSSEILNIENWIPVSKEQALANDLIKAEEIHKACIGFLILSSSEDEGCHNFSVVQKLNNDKFFFCFGTMAAGTTIKSNNLPKLLEIIYFSTLAKTKG